MKRVGDEEIVGTYRGTLGCRVGRETSGTVCRGAKQGGGGWGVATPP